MAKQKFNFQLTNPAAQPVAVSGEQGTNAGTVASIVQRLDNNDKKIIKQFEKTYKHHIDVIDINMSGICEKCLEKKAA